jgi:uncharacterized membrane protein
MFWHDHVRLRRGRLSGFREFMTSLVHNFSSRVWFGLLTLAPILILPVLVLLAPPDGNERAQLLQFFGRFHILAIHLPIALLAMVPVLELAGRSRHFPYLLPSAGFLLGVATCGAIVAAVLGWCLARSGGYSGPLVTQHMWGGVAVAFAAWLCWVFRARSSESHLDPVYAIALLATVGLVSFTGYRGGQVSQGENHLTEHMPAPLRSLLGLPAFEISETVSSNGGPATFYGAHIQPVFTGHCIGCHGRDKHRANLRLYSYNAVMRGSKHGPVIKAGDPKSSKLFHRVTLPPTDDDFMPAQNKPPLSSGEVKLIELWISAGASGTQLADSIKDLPPDATPLTAVAEVNFEQLDPVAIAKQRAGLAPLVAQLQQRFPGVLDYESRGSADLVINACLLASKFGDNDLAALAPLSEHIVVADFSGTAITNSSSSILSAMKRLRSLRLMHTKITDATVEALAPLSQLESLNLFDTPVTPAALTPIGHLPKLRHLYVHETKISPDAPMSEAMKGKIIF